MATSRVFRYVIGTTLFLALLFAQSRAQDRPVSAADELKQLMGGPARAKSPKPEKQHVAKAEAVTSKPVAHEKSPAVHVEPKSEPVPVVESASRTEVSTSRVSDAPERVTESGSFFMSSTFALLLAGCSVIIVTIKRRSLMKWLYDLKIGTKLLLGFGVVAMIAGVIGYVGVTGLKAAEESDTILYTHQTVPLAQIAEVAEYFQRVRVNTRDIILAQTQEEKRVYADRIKSYRERISRATDEFEKTILSQSVRDAFNTFKASRVDYGKHLDQLEVLAMANKSAEAFALLKGEMAKSAKIEEEAITRLAELKVKNAQERSDMNTVNANAAMETMLIVLGIGIVASMAIGIFISRIISRPVKEVVASIDNADLNMQFNSQRKDEVGDLQRSFDRFVVSIKGTLVQVSEAASAVASASNEISSSTEEMAAGAQEQTSQAGEVASAVEEMTKTIVENSRNASSTADTARQAKVAAEQGGTVVEETVSGMKRIAHVVKESAGTVQELGKSSDQIGEIIGVIDDIADQT
jgi:methyl-accepting chemotaxis protein